MNVGNAVNVIVEGFAEMARRVDPEGYRDNPTEATARVAAAFFEACEGPCDEDGEPEDWGLLTPI